MENILDGATVQRIVEVKRSHTALTETVYNGAGDSFQSML